MLENDCLTSARGGTGMTGVAVGMQLSPSGGGGQGQEQGLIDLFEQEHAQKRSRIEHGEADYDERHNLKKTTTAQEKVGIMVRLMAMKDNGVKPSKPAKTFVTRQMLPFMKCFKDHFNSDEVAFCQAFPIYQHTKHNQECSSKCQQE